MLRHVPGMGSWCLTRPMLVGCLVVTAGATIAAAEKEHYSIDVGKLVADFSPERIVSDDAVRQASFYQKDVAPRVVIANGGEAYMLAAANPNNAYLGYRIIGEKPKGKATQGSVYLLRRDPEHRRDPVLAKFDFEVPDEVAKPAKREDFLRAKGRHFLRLWSEEMAGSAVFRHLAVSCLSEIGESTDRDSQAWPRRRPEGVDRTIQMMSGGRAVSENLQLDQQLPDTTDDGEALVDLKTIEGITVTEIDWKSRLTDQPTDLDPLARAIPHDQYAVFVSSFPALTELLDRSGDLVRPLTGPLEEQSRTVDVIGFYQRQLGLPLDTVTRQLGKRMISEVAITGSDPYFRTGTDVAVLINSDQPQLLHQAIVALVESQANLQWAVERSQQQIAGRKVIGWENPSRDFSSVVTATDDAVIVTNSWTQVTQILDCLDRNRPCLDELDEYRFFRQRYRRGEGDESALLMISDATIRRWCGPEWRIAASRRTRARARIADVTVKNADALIHGEVTELRRVDPARDEGPVARGDGPPRRDGRTVARGDGPARRDGRTVGKLELTPVGVVSSSYGSLRFQTPISELNLTHATKDEVQAYEAWRTRYERRWRNVFDPIACRISLRPNELHADLSVIPLMLGTEYRWWVDLVGEATLAVDAGDRHPDTLASLLFALDVDGAAFRFARAFVGRNQPVDVDPLSWVDGAIHFYLDTDEAWMKQLSEQSPWERNPEKEASDAPIGIYVPSRDSLRLAAFMVAVRDMIERFAPNTVTWGTDTYRDMKFVTITPENLTSVGPDTQWFYVTTPDGLTISPNRGVIERAIDRHLERMAKQSHEPSQSGEPTDAEQSAAEDAGRRQAELMVTGKGVRALVDIEPTRVLRRVHRASWSNLPILNYFQDRYPDRDPVEVYRKLFGETIVEPSGGRYEWNAERQTYVSSLHGYHLEPQAGPRVSPEWAAEDRLRATVAFTDGGLRATFTVTQSQ